MEMQKATNVIKVTDVMTYKRALNMAQRIADDKKNSILQSIFNKIDEPTQDYLKRSMADYFLFCWEMGKANQNLRNHEPMVSGEVTFVDGTVDLLNLEKTRLGFIATHPKNFRKALVEFTEIYDGVNCYEEVYGE